MNRTKQLLNYEHVAPHPYKSCHVDGIFINQDHLIGRSKLYTEGERIEDAEHLHKIIGREIVINYPHLSYKDVRFLRKQMKLSQNQLANQLGTSTEAIVRYEQADHPDIAGSPDRLLRFLYVLTLFPDMHVQINETIQKLYQKSNQRTPRLLFSKDKYNKEWIFSGVY
jgi:DNA-binding transcriptional regulator YiaG